MYEMNDDRVGAAVGSRHGLGGTAALVCAALLALAAGPVWSHGDEKHSDAKQEALAPEQQAWGIAGDPAQVTRTIRVQMLDTMRFDPSDVVVRPGETVRFEVANAGQVMHEMVLGTKESLDEHARMMARFPNMEHDEPYMVHVAPAKNGAMVWHFNRPGTFDFACLIPGHYQAGMVGRITVQ